VGRPAEAREALERAVVLAPQLADAWNLLGLVAQEGGDHDEASRHFDRALALRPDFALAAMNRANSLQARGRLDAAIAGYAQALAVAPTNAAIHYNLGHLHHKVSGRVDDAIAGYREAIRLDPQFADAHLNLAALFLLVGRLPEGWGEFAWRPQRRAYVAERARLGDPYDLLKVASSGRFEIRGEQGLGDILFFLRYAARAKEQGIALAFNGDARLHPILARTGLFERVTDAPGPSAGEVLAGDLPLLFEEPPLPPPLALSPEPAGLERMRARLVRAGPPPWIALTWRAGERSRGLFDRLFKEVSPAALGSALHGVQATWISVQREPGAGDHESLERALGAPVRDFSDVNATLEDALALMELVDDYVGVSNTNMHLRAGLGGGARVLVAFGPEWRWGREGPSPWFSSRMVPYREAAGGDWSRALAALSRDKIQ
jgi:hypothetical protein